MPVTPAHIAAVLPLARWHRHLPFAALAIGAMIPDFPLFFPQISPEYDVTHSLPGLVTACIPLGMTSYLWFHYLVKVPLVGLFPNFIQHRLPLAQRPQLPPSVNFYLRVAFALWLGALTHVVWDSFTHEHRWGTRRFPILNESLAIMPDREVAYYKLLQYGSAAVGLPLLVLAGGWWLRAMPPQATSLPPRRPWLRWGMLLSVIGFPTAWAIYRYLRSDESAYVRLHELVTRSGAGLIICLTLYAGIFHVATCGRYLADDWRDHFPMKTK